MKEYPRIDSYSGGYSAMRKTCTFCQKKNDLHLRIQTNWFRGDDLMVNVCKECKKTKTLDALMMVAK